MRSCLLQQLSELFKISTPKNRDSSVVSKKTRTLRSINRTGHTIKMTSLVLILLEERTETLSLQENAERCLLFTSGIQTLCLPLLHSILELLLKVQVPYLSVHVKDMLLLLIRVMITPCISIMFKERRCFCPFQQDLTLLLIFSGLKNQTISNSLLSLQVLFSSGIQLMPVRNYTKTVHSDQNSPKLDSIAPFSTKMESAIPVVLTVVSTFGIKNKISVQFLRLTLVRLLPQHALRVSLSQLVKMICSLSSLVTRESINS